MKLKEKRVSDVLWKLFYLAVGMLCIWLIYLALHENPQQATDGKIFLLEAFAGILVFGVVAIILINSISVVGYYEDIVRWRKKDIKWRSDGILAIDKLLSLPDNELRQKIGDIGIAKMTINGTDHRFNVSTHLFLIEDIRESLWSRKMSLTEELSQKRTIPEEPRIVAFWRKSLAFLLEKQQAIEVDGI